MGQVYLFFGAVMVAYVVGSLLGRERRRADELEDRLQYWLYPR